MSTSTGLIAVIPAPKETPLDRVYEAIEFADHCREITRTIVASDQPIESQFKPPTWFFSAKTEWLTRPAPRPQLLLPAAEYTERREGEMIRLVMHLDPLRLPPDPLVVFECLQHLLINGFADGIVGVVPGKGGIAEREGWLHLDPSGPYQLDPAVCVLKTEFLAGAGDNWLSSGRFLPYHAAQAGPMPRGGFM